ncbi:GspB domain-containing protein, partial [Aromatoleum toluvorans]
AAPVARTRRETAAPEAPPPAAETARTRRSESGARKTAEASPASPPAVPAAAAPAPARAATAPDNAGETSPPANRKPSDGRILSIHELPPAIRGSLPRLSISGVAAAPNAGKSWALINDRLVQEGDEVEPGLTLTSAAKDGVVLDYKGYRFRAQQ